MPKMIVSIDGVVIKEVQLTKDRTTLGRRPYNDVVIDNLAVSGEHAVLQMSGSDVFLEDLNSTNGTYVNGKAIKKQQLQGGDTIEIGKYKIKFVHEGGESYEKTMVINAGAVVAPDSGAGVDHHPPPRAAGAGRHQGHQRLGRRPRGCAHQGRHHHRQARRGGGGHYAPPARLRRGHGRGHRQAHHQRRPPGHRGQGPAPRRRAGTCGHADAVRPGLIDPGNLLTAGA
jgi:hypothetical protein